MGEDLAKVKSSLAGNAEKASRWYEVNLLKGNFSKYKTMLMHNDDKVTRSLRLNIQGNEIELRDKLPLLRVSIDCNLNFSDHIKMAAYLNEIGNPSNPCYVSGIRKCQDASELRFFTAATTNTRPQRVFSSVQTCVLVDANQPLPLFFTLADLKKFLSLFLAHSEEYAGVLAIFAIFCYRI